MMLLKNVSKALLRQLLSLISIESIKERVRKNFEYVVNDDEVVLDVMFGYDEKTSVIIVLTNKHLYVLGDTIIHKVKRNEILDMLEYKGLVSRLIEVLTVTEDPIYFKVYSKRAVTALKEWLK